MADQDPHKMIEKIDAVTSKSGASRSIVEQDPSQSVVAPNKEEFDRLMTQPAQRRQVAMDAPATQKPSLMDEVRLLSQKVNDVSKASPKDLVGKSRDLIAQIEEIKTQLQGSKGEIKGSVQNLLRDKLAHIDENLKIALDKAGVEYQLPEPDLAASQTPVQRFLGMLTHGQYQLQTMALELEHISQAKQDLNPAQLLVLQMKVNYVQQELEFFTNLLNKGLESTKTLMNVQV
ncbi:MAG: hypothetical protein KDK65_05930 [Chlamydiia bacterium]|nr:hypothetical protein [Chlamydiia bacterium]